MPKRETDNDEVGAAKKGDGIAKKSKLDSNGTHSSNVICGGHFTNICGPKDDERCLNDTKKPSIEGTGGTDRMAGPATSVSTTPGSQSSSPAQSQTTLPPNSAEDREYFASYGRLDIHRTMIDDWARTQAYRRAILTNYPLFYGKTVLDVGCGTGILSVFCCQAGARRVYAVEASGAAEYARAVAAENGYSDRVRVLQCRVEEAALPEPVDVIVSEWMGHALLYESMLESVLVARDRWLRPGGALFPERAQLKVALCSAPELALEEGAAEFWRGVHDRYKVKMTCLAEVEERSRWSDLPTRVCALLPEEVHSHAATLCDLDLRTVSTESLRELRAADVELTSFGRARLAGLALWFDVRFPGGEVLSTSPYETETHWGQTVLPLEPVDLDQDSTVRCPMVLRPDSKHPRNWRFSVELAVDGGNPRSLEWVMDGTS